MAVPTTLTNVSVSAIDSAGEATVSVADVPLDEDLTHLCIRLWVNTGSGFASDDGIHTELSFNGGSDYWHTFSGLNSSNSYRVTVTAVNEDGESSQTSPAEF